LTWLSVISSDPTAATAKATTTQAHPWNRPEEYVHDLGVLTSIPRSKSRENRENVNLENWRRVSESAKDSQTTE
jgi:hypothetical protein